MRLVIEEITRNKKVLRYHTFDVNKASENQPSAAKRIRVGRAYDNDIILNELHVSPHHVEIELQNDACWYLKDCNSLNAVRDEKGKVFSENRPLISGDVIQLGRCQLRVWDARHPVESTWPLHRAEDIFHRIGEVKSIIALFFLMVLVTAFFTTFEEAKSETWLAQAPGMLVTALLIVLWASAWSLVGRIVKQESRFYAQLAVSILAFTLIQPIEWLTRVLAFNTGLDLWHNVVQLFFVAIVASLLLWSHLFLSISQRPRYRILLSLGLVWSLTALKVAPEFSRDEQYRSPRYPSLVVPPAVNWTQGVSEVEFIKKTETLFSAHKIEPKENNSETKTDSKEK